jgi:hypothetical protein
MTRVFMKSDAYVSLEHTKKEALLRHSRVIQAFAMALVDFGKAKSLQKERQSSFYVSLRGAALKLIDLQDEEGAARDQLESRLTKQREDIHSAYEAKMKELLKEHRRIILERQRELFEKRQREEALKQEKLRIRNLRMEAERRQKEDEERQMRELQALRGEVLSTARAKQQRELLEAIEVKSAVEQQLLDESKRIVEERERKREEDRQKAERAKQKRIEMEKQHQARARYVARSTEVEQQRGEMLKAVTQFTKKLEREEQVLKTTIRRSEIAAKLADEAERRDAVLSMKIAVAEARYTYNKARKEQMQRDHCVRRHMSEVEKIEEMRVIDDMQREKQRKDGVSAGAANDTRAVLSVIKRLDRVEGKHKEATSLSECSGSKIIGNRAKAHHTKLYEIQRDLVQAGKTPRVKSPAALSIQRLYRDPLSPSIPPIDAHTYDRLAGGDQKIIQKYGTAALASRPLYSLPWRI